MAAREMSPALLAELSERFKALAEPARLQLLTALRGGERSVSDLVAVTGLGQANVSKHLQQLTAAGFLARRKDGTFAYYSLADDRVFQLCDLMCGRIEAEQRERRAALKLAR
ncbi:MAG: helix-turn-helix domain-containing protein [Gemmatimonadales bacterium]|nr:helix-turn-helix transcriptional regulator [Gemmatimonadota bacterium]MCL4213992.1 helix-turn-helix domain-containing protein [Gemmatimonadales bacterium]